MRVSVILERLRVTCPSFATVDHALTSPTTITYPAALVVPVKRMARPNQFLGVHAQMVDVTFGIHILIRRRQDGPTDAGAADDLDDLFAEVLAALKAWTPDGAIYKPFDYAGGQLAPFQDQNVTWREDFSTSYDVRTTP